MKISLLALIVLITMSAAQSQTVDEYSDTSEEEFYNSEQPEDVLTPDVFPLPPEEFSEMQRQEALESEIGEESDFMGSEEFPMEQQE